MPTPHILIVGGAGYIGSHMVKMLARLGCQVTTLDDLSSCWPATLCRAVVATALF